MLIAGIVQPGAEIVMFPAVLVIEVGEFAAVENVNVPEVFVVTAPSEV